jgi:hypothetical protein
MSTPLSFPLVSFPLALAPPSEAGLFLQGDAKASKQESLPPSASAALPNRSARARPLAQTWDLRPVLALGLLAPYMVAAKQENSSLLPGGPRVRESPPHQRNVLTH